MYDGDIAPTPTAPDLPPVPNGTNTGSGDWMHFAQEYKGFGKKTVESYLGQCSTLTEAKQSLNETGLDQFCGAVGLDQKGSTFRKAHRIGEAVSRFRPFIERLPNTWTTLYQLAKLDPEQFDQLAASGALSPAITGKDITAHFGTTKPRTARRKLVLDLSNLDPDTYRAAHAAILKLEEIYAFKVKETATAAGGDQ